MGLGYDSVFIHEFLSDITSRLMNLHASLKTLDVREGLRSNQSLAGMNRDLHTIKGTSLSFGFATLANLAGKAENLLAKVSKSDLNTTEALSGSLSEILLQMKISCDELRGIFKSFEEKDGTRMVPVPESQLKKLHELRRRFEQGDKADANLLKDLLRACETIDYVLLETVASKYRLMFENISRELGKRIEFKTRPAGQMVSPYLFSILTEPLVHIFRNAADHGIELEASRLLAGKPGTGLVELQWLESEQGVGITITDDGAGIDGDALAQKARLMGLFTNPVLDAMNADEKLRLIFHPSLSSREIATDISGRGIGMDAVANWAKRFGSSIDLASVLGKGTRITLKIPKLIPENPEE